MDEFLSKEGKSDNLDDNDECEDCKKSDCDECENEDCDICNNLF
jgi:hypothetical protein